MIKITSFGILRSDCDWRDRYLHRIRELMPFEWREIPLKRSPNERTNELTSEEAAFLKKEKRFWLLDSGGKEMSSEEFYGWLFREGDRHLVVGMAVGFHPEFYKQAEGKISLSKLTFMHSLAQLMLAEALYRSACMLKNHPFVK